MVVLQQYLYGLLFFGLMGFLFGAIREFRELKPVHKDHKLTRAEWASTFNRGARVFSRMLFWWTVMYALVLFAARSQG